MFDTSMTRKDLEIHLTSLGITGDAAAAIVKETAPARHAERIASAKAHVDTYVQNLFEEKFVLEDEAEYVFIALLDVMGVGGRMGVEGLSTDRHPAFSKCGSGRKQAGDGPAWSAAIESLIVNPPQYAKWDFSAWVQRNTSDDGTAKVFWALGIEAPGDGVPCTHAKVDENEYDAAWKLTLAREGLRISVGLAPWHHGTYMDLFNWESLSSADWAGLVNHYTALVEKNNTRKFGDSIDEIRAAGEAAELCLTSSHPCPF